MNTPTSLAEHVSQLLAVEAAAGVVRAWHPSLIPGILQTETYAAAAIRASAPSLPLDQVRALAVERSRRLDAHTGREVRVIIGESALRRPVAGPHVLAQQLRHLLALMALRPFLDVRVMPTRADDGHPALVGEFSIYDRAVYLESLFGGTVLDLPERTLPYTYAWDHAQRQAADRVRSRRIILETRRRLEARGH